jgi:hypothetical protein
MEVINRLSRIALRTILFDHVLFSFAISTTLNDASRSSMMSNVFLGICILPLVSIVPMKA